MEMCYPMFVGIDTVDLWYGNLIHGMTNLIFAVKSTRMSSGLKAALLR